TALYAMNSGNWQPLAGGGSGNSPANYGGKVTIVLFSANLALRDLVISGFTNDPLTLSGNGPYSFASTQMLTLLGGAADYNAGFLGSGSTDLAGLSSPNQSPVTGTFEDLGGGSYRITEPISFTVHQFISGLQATLHAEGQVVANA